MAESIRDVLSNFHLFTALIAVLTVVLILFGYQYVAAGVQLCMVVLAAAVGV